MKPRSQNKTFFQLIAGSVLVVAAVSGDYPAPAPTPSDPSAAMAPGPTTDDSYDSPTEIYPETPSPSAVDIPYSDTEPTPPPVPAGTSSPTDYYVETTEEGGMYEVPSEPAGGGGGDEEEEEEAAGEPLDNTEEGSSCSTYDEDEHVARLLPETCEWNTYMCCWTGHDGQGSMYGNADVCRVFDYPEEGDVLELPRDDEGPVYCHGFAWADGADIASHVLPLYHYVINVNRTDEGGYYGNVEGAPECGCIEDMPVVSEAACSKYGGEGIEPCWGNSLRTQYKYKLEEPNGEMDFNLVNSCDNEDVPDYDYRTCAHNTYMCCWTENDGNGMKDNTDVCRVGEMGYPGESEGEVHCHGFVWPEDATDKYIHLLAQFVQHYDHRDRRGYFGSLPDAPMCGCVEDMPEVSEADCTTYDEEVGREGKFTACTNNDLLTRYLELYPAGDIANLVEECDNEDVTA